MRDIMFEIPSNPNIEKCIVTKQTVLEKAEPMLEINENKEQNAVKIEKVKAKKRKTAGEKNRTA